MSFKLTILGCSSATPTVERHSSAQVLNVNERLFLIDCGEGAQIQMRRFKIKFQRIDHIFISHLHGDHYLGLMGLLFTLHLLGRKKELHLYADNDLKEILDIQLEISKTTLVYPLIFHPVDSTLSEIIYEDKNIVVRTIPLDHRIPTTGFLFIEKQKERKIKKEILQKIDIPEEAFDSIKKGHGFTDVNKKYHSNAELTIAGPKSVSYAYCSDTGYTDSYLSIINGVDLLYHEATFLRDKEKSAREKFHCTAYDAATIANKAKVKKLMLGHYSARYDDLSPLLEEAKKEFNNSILAEEGMTYDIS
ncbi:MAG TPA: ribonuclease Z [Bacteroidales bacterium]|nr:ribonuclease Z [Bacteroidales bacterium]HPS16908.1 ribonuclease Z [Bacteroidales bacterium]